jgi:hypothetical protein
MSERTPEGILSRNLGQMAQQDRDLAVWAMLLVKHFSSEVYYTPIGSAERDAEARLKGEFESDFKDPSERSAADILADTCAIPTDPADFGALELEGELLYA